MKSAAVYSGRFHLSRLGGDGLNVSIYVPDEGGVLRTSIERSGRPGAALLLCGALLIVPLIAIQTGSSSAASGPGLGHAHQASAPPSHGGYFPAWQLAADSIKTDQMHDAR